MMEAELLGFRSWLVPDEAAQYLTHQLRTNFQGTDILRLALDGDLQLSVHLPVPVEAAICEEGEPTSEYTLADGVWTLLLEGQGKLEIESLFALGTGGPEIRIDSGWVAGITRGAHVTKGDIRCELPGTFGVGIRRGSALPQTAQVVVTMDVLRKFELALLILRNDAFRNALTPLRTKPAAADDDSQPLKTRERQTLYAIIAALASLAKVDLSTPSKSAAAIESETERLGSRVAPRTISNHLNAAAKAVDWSMRGRP